MLVRIFKMNATSGFLIGLDSTKFVFNLAPPRSPLGSLQHSVRPLARLRNLRRELGKEGGPILTQIPVFTPNPFEIFWLCLVHC